MPPQTFVAVLIAALHVGARPGQTHPPRRVYALHAGVHILFSHPDKNYAAFVLRDELVRRKVPAKDIVVLDNPFPVASWKSIVPREGLIMFLDAIDPASRFSQDAYLRMHQSFAEQGVGSDDQIVWIGHSAGGQIGLTMAHLAASLERYPALRKQAPAYRFTRIVTLGTPVGSNHVPPGVQVRHHYSPADKIVRIVCDVGPWLAPALGYRQAFGPCAPGSGPNCRVHCWPAVEHYEWIWEERVLDRLLQDLSPACPARWNEPVPVTHAGGLLPQLVYRMLDRQQGICMEEFP